MSTLPPELHRFSRLQFIKKRGHNEWSAECPRCGDVGHVGTDWPDRFRMWGGKGARGWCRGCQHFEWADEGQSISPLAKKRIEREHKQRVAQERERVRSKIERLQQEAYWRGYHDGMTEEHRALWREEGIPDEAQDWFTLGYVAEKTYYHDDHKHTCPALSIPYNNSGRIVNVQFKLLNPVHNAGKYRFTHSLPPAMFFAEPEKEPGGSALVVEGAKKAIILFLHLGHRFDHVIGLPSKYPTQDMTDYLSNYDTVHLTLDPDAFTDEREDSPNSATRIATAIDSEVRVVQLFDKPDDYIVKHGGTARDLHNMILQGRPIH